MTVVNFASKNRAQDKSAIATSEGGVSSEPETYNVALPASEDKALTEKVKAFDRWAVYGLRDAFLSEENQPAWVIKELLMSQSGTLVSAKPHAMKSLSWLAACIEAPLTGEVWGHFEAPSVDSTLFIETEDPRWLVESRIVGLAKGFGLKRTDDIPGFHYACVGPFSLEKEAPSLESLIDKYQPKFIVLSTLQSLLEGRSWNSQEHMQPIMATVIRLSRRSPIVLITHSPQDDSQRRAAGTITQAANFPTLLHYQKTTSTSVKLTMDSKAGMGGRGFSLRLDAEGSPDDPGSVRRVLYDGVPKRAKSDKKDLVKEYIASQPRASTAEIVAGVGATAGVVVTPRYVQEIKKEMAETS